VLALRVALACFALALSCSPGSVKRGEAAGANGSGAASGQGAMPSLGGSVTLCHGDDCDPSDLPAPENCGDGQLTEDEACDDGNRDDGDGCAGNCLAVDAGYSCNPPGAPCHVVALCGDGVVASNEMCDDQNADDGDGCSARCKLERGYKCDGEPSACSATTCGDGVPEGAESCDDGNAIPLDGCSATCQAEPDCSAGSCTSDCGDGLVINEGCDDGNTLDGDGCSSTCEQEPGFECSQRASCLMVGGECVLEVPAVFRDFTNTHADFHCGGGSDPPTIEPTLNDLGKPVLVSGNPGCISSAATFAEWYTDGPQNRVIPGSILLFEGPGGFVNRHGADGTRWTDVNGLELDGTPVFLPIDDAPNIFPDGRSKASIPPEYTGDNQWHDEDFFVTGAGATHNFLFTTEVQYWFRYDAGFSATLNFLGDDDVWVFVNGHLALDLGGLHVPKAGSVLVDDTTAGAYELSAGNVYSVKVFHAERNPTGSSFKLTLSGFENTPSECTPVCGDGVVSLGEQCDDGDNDGGYGECEPECKLGARCGDRIVQAEEDCDDGNRLDGDGCGSACRNVVVK
jgi:fibro-slime domain-containing protein